MGARLGFAVDLQDPHHFWWRAAHIWAQKDADLERVLGFGILRSPRPPNRLGMPPWGSPVPVQGRWGGWGWWKSRREVCSQPGAQFWGTKLGREWELGGAGWAPTSFRAASSREDQWFWGLAVRNSFPPLIGGISNIPAAWVPATWLVLALGLSSLGEAGDASYPQVPPGFGRGTQVFISSHHPKRRVFLPGWARLGRFLRLSFSPLQFFFLRALEGDAWLQSRVEVPGWSSWAQHTSDTPPLLT